MVTDTNGDMLRVTNLLVILKAAIRFFTLPLVPLVLLVLKIMSLYYTLSLKSNNRWQRL